MQIALRRTGSCKLVTGVRAREYTARAGGFLWLPGWSVRSGFL